MRLPAMIILLATAIPAFAAAATSAPAPAAARPERKVATIQAEMRSENWNWYGEGAHIAASMPSQQQSPEKFERVDTEQGQAPTFSGKVMGIPPGKRAHVTVVANVGNQWTSANNYKSAPVAADGTFTVAADHNPAAVKSLAVNLDGSGISHFLPAEFQARQSARDIEFQLPETKSTVLSMEDPQGKEVRNFRVEIFNAFPMRDAQTNRVLRIQRLFAASSAGGVIVFDAPADAPIALLVSAPGTAIAPYYEIITPRDAAEFHFKMIPAARLRGVVTRDGQPLASESMLIINPAAPMSATLRTTDAQGRFDIQSRVPGKQDLRVAGFQTTIDVQPGETAEVNIDVGISRPTRGPTRVPASTARQ